MSEDERQNEGRRDGGEPLETERDSGAAAASTIQLGVGMSPRTGESVIVYKVDDSLYELSPTEAMICAEGFLATLVSLVNGDVPFHLTASVVAHAPAEEAIQQAVIAIQAAQSALSDNYLLEYVQLRLGMSQQEAIDLVRGLRQFSAQRAERFYQPS